MDLIRSAGVRQRARAVWLRRGGAALCLAGADRRGRLFDARRRQMRQRRRPAVAGPASNRKRRVLMVMMSQCVERRQHD